MQQMQKQILQQMQQQQQQQQQQQLQQQLHQYVSNCSVLHTGCVLSKLLSPARKKKKKKFTREIRQQARFANSFATDNTHLMLVHNAAGAIPPHWPAEATPARVTHLRDEPAGDSDPALLSAACRRYTCSQSTQGVDACWCTFLTLYKQSP